MARVLTCVDPVPASDGTCTDQAWLDQPSFLPTLSAEQGLELSGLLITVMATAWGFSFLRRYLSPKTG